MFCQKNFISVNFSIVVCGVGGFCFDVLFNKHVERSKSMSSRMIVLYLIQDKHLIYFQSEIRGTLYNNNRDVSLLFLKNTHFWSNPLPNNKENLRLCNIIRKRSFKVSRKTFEVVLCSKWYISRFIKKYFFCY